jgi:hypothetical protein
MTPTDLDWLKYIRAQGTATLEYVVDAIAGNLDMPDDPADHLCDAIDSVRHLVAEPPIIANESRYSDGRPVYSEVQIDPSWEPMRYVWHPDPAHERNQPQTFKGVVRGPSGRARRVIISAPGVLDAVDVIA